MKYIAYTVIAFALIGALNTCFWLGKITYRWGLAIDELLRQRKERKD